LSYDDSPEHPGEIQILAKTYNDFTAGVLENQQGFCAVATTEEIEKQDYILTPGRYVGFKEDNVDDEPFDQKMERLTSELSDMFNKSHEIEAEIRKNLGALGYEI
jgi:type I restriction enzyme M protein